MARNFVTASTQYMTIASTPITVVPLTMSAWFKPASAHNGQILQIQSSLGTLVSDNTFSLRALSTQKLRGATNGVSADTTANYTLNVWNHAFFVTSAINTRTIYLNGGNVITNASTATPVTIDTTTIGGSLNVGGALNTFNGDIAECGIWNVALTVDEVGALASGVSPLRIRPLSLKGYWPCHGVATVAEPDYTSGQRKLTLTNSPIASTTHPRTSPAYGYSVSGGIREVAASQGGGGGSSRMLLLGA